MFLPQLLSVAHPAVSYTHLYSTCLHADAVCMAAYTCGFMTSVSITTGACSASIDLILQHSIVYIDLTLQHCVADIVTASHCKTTLMVLHWHRTATLCCWYCSCNTTLLVSYWSYTLYNTVLLVLWPFPATTFIVKLAAWQQVLINLIRECNFAISMCNRSKPCESTFTIVDLTNLQFS